MGEGIESYRLPAINPVLPAPAHPQKLYLLPQTPEAPCSPNPCSPTSCACSPRSLGAPLPSQPLLTCSLTAPCPWAAPSASPAPLAPPGALSPAQLHSSLLYFLGSALVPGHARCPHGLRATPLEELCPPRPLLAEVLPLLSALLYPSTHILLWPLAASTFQVTCPLSSSRCWSSGPGLWSVPCVLGSCGLSPVLPAVDTEPGRPCSPAPRLCLCTRLQPSRDPQSCTWPCPGPTPAPAACPGAVTALGSSPFPAPHIRPSFCPGWSSCLPSPGLQSPWSRVALSSRPQPVLLLLGSPRAPQAAGSVPALVWYRDRAQLPPLACSAAPAPPGVPRPVSLQGSHSYPCVLILGVPTHPWWGLWRGLPCSLGLQAPSLLWPQTHVAPGVCVLSAALLPSTCDLAPRGVNSLPPVLQTCKVD